MVVIQPCCAAARGRDKARAVCCHWLCRQQTGFIAASPTIQELDQALERAWQARGGEWRQMGLSARIALAKLDQWRELCSTQVSATARSSLENA